jgi:hypothetical protein
MNTPSATLRWFWSRSITRCERTWWPQDASRSNSIKACSSKPAQKDSLGIIVDLLCQDALVALYTCLVLTRGAVLGTSVRHGRCLQSLHMTEEISHVETEMDRIRMETDLDVTFLPYFKSDFKYRYGSCQIHIQNECLIFWFLFGYLLNSAQSVYS